MTSWFWTAAGLIEPFNRYAQSSFRQAKKASGHNRIIISKSKSSSIRFLDAAKTDQKKF
jgi:hypothetical protein